MDLESAATRLSVHYQTVYRWVRAGLLPAVKVGSSYEIADADVAEFARNRNGKAAAPVRAQLGRRVDQLAGALAGGEERSARSLLLSTHESGLAPIALCDELVLPAMRQVDEAGAAGTVSNAERLVAVGICERLVGLLAFPPPGRPRGVAMVAGPEPAGPRLPNLLALVALRSDRWRVHDLGVNVPAPDIVGFAAELGPAVVVLAAAGHRKIGDLQSSIERSVAVPVLWYEPGTMLADLIARVRRMTTAEWESSSPDRQ